MAGTRTPEGSSPVIDPAKAPVAYGNRALPQLKMELQGPQLLIRQQALATLCDLVHEPGRVYEAVQTGFVDVLKDLLKDTDSVVRVKTTEVFYLLASQNVGREAFLSSNVLGPLVALLDHPVDACRKNTHRVLKTIAEFPTGAAYLVAQGVVPRLVQQVVGEREDIRVLMLNTLTSCVWVDALPGLLSGGLPVLCQQLSDPSPDIRRAATAAMVGMSVPLQGKVYMCEENVVPLLVSSLSDSDPGVISNATAAITYTAVTTKGKHQVLQAGAICPLLRLVQSEDWALCGNALRALTALAEVPSGRQRLLEHIPLLESCLGHPHSVIQRAAATAISVISWTP
ncbi:radial spoke head 14 homolog isoform X2 [Denticeps clupeoides]|uniref:Dynein axonemal assembly factor 5 TPR repeats domain-containing protein n=2 Tax=Denticeps clupeoides TaxID=299321 RepID=A0AAY4DDW4_9TELE|nr:radial spoke head 14 homolog isoform X2 [Denticeps clupeoides]